MTDTDHIEAQEIDAQEYAGDMDLERESEKLTLVPDDPKKVPQEGDDTANHNRFGGGG